MSKTLLAISSMKAFVWDESNVGFFWSNSEGKD